MTSETTAKKDVQRLQRAIVDGLEDVKAQDIVVFNTEALSPLFERVIVASGTSNRQTKALAASVRDAVREAGFDKPRIEGEENGEWIIVDCGAAVAHVMQPVIRQYYRLEEIWGAKPVRLKHGAEKPAKPEVKPAVKARTRKGASDVAAVAPVAAKNVARTAARAAAKSTPAKPGKPAVTAAAKPVARTAAKGVSKKVVPGASVQPKVAVKTLVVKPKSATRPAAKTPAKGSTPRPAAKSPSRAAAKAAPKKKA